MAVGAALEVLPQPRAWPYWVAVAITVAFGFETLRGLLSLLVYVLRDGHGWDAVQVGILALAIFGTGFLAGLFARGLGATTALALSAGGVGLMRFMAQVWPNYPLVDLCLTIAGAVFFILFLFTLVEFAKGEDGPGTTNSGLALLLGVSLDTLLLGTFDTWEAFWRTGMGSTWMVTFMFTTQVFCIVFMSSSKLPEERPSGRDRTSQPRTGISFPWLAVGPVIFLQLQIFQNLASLAAVTGWTLPQAFLCIVISNVVGLLTATLLAGKPSFGRWGPAALLGVLLTVGLALGFNSYPWGTAVALIVGNACLSGLLMIIFCALEARGREEVPESGGLNRDPQAGGRGGSMFHGMGMVLLMGLLFGYYASLELEMPFSREMLLPVAGAIVGLAALGASIIRRPDAKSWIPVWGPAAFAALFAIVPVVMLLTWQAPQQKPGDGYPVRVMTYNLHNGFNTDGKLDLAELARVIEDEAPDIVALQEVSRGWVINGSSDMLLWLSQCLDLPYLYGPSVGKMWGNAVLSRFPVAEWGTVDMPPRDLPLRRQFTWVDFDLGQGEQLRVIATHFHHTEGDHEERLLQAESVLSFWDAHPQTIVLADLNAEPDWPEMLGFWRAGFSDALEGIDNRATFPSFEPVERIDYVLASSDLELSDPVILQTTASDHLPVVATVDKGR